MSNDFSWYVSKLAKWVSEKLRKKTRETLNKIKGYYKRIRKRFVILWKKLKEKWVTNWKPVIRYGAFVLTPYVLAYGALTNLVTHHFLAFQISLMSIVAHGLLWYFIKEEITEIVESLRPTVKADVKVKDR